MENSLCPPCATVSKFSKYVGQRVTLPPSQKNFIADLDGLEHTKKIVKMSKVWDELNSHLTPPPHTKPHQTIPKMLQFNRKYEEVVEEGKSPKVLNPRVLRSKGPKYPRSHGPRYLKSHIQIRA